MDPTVGLLKVCTKHFLGRSWCGGFMACRKKLRFGDLICFPECFPKQVIRIPLKWDTPSTLQAVLSLGFANMIRVAPIPPDRQSNFGPEGKPWPSMKPNLSRMGALAINTNRAQNHIFATIAQFCPVRLWAYISFLQHIQGYWHVAGILHAKTGVIIAMNSLPIEIERRLRDQGHTMFQKTTV